MFNKIIFCYFLLFLTFNSSAQQGGFIDIYTSALFCSIDNNYDSYYGPYNGLGYDFEHPQTLSYGASILYSKATENFVGWRTGLQFGNYSQKFSSRIEIADFDSLSYTSTFTIQQFSAPFLVNFGINSGETNDRIFFNMGFGLQLNYLSNASFSINPQGNYNVTEQFEFKNYFRHFGMSYLLSIELKMGIGRGDKSYILMGVFYDKTIGGIEKPGIDFNQSTPKELIYPIGTLKDYNYDVPNERDWSKMKTEALTIKLGYSYKLFK